MEEEEQGYHIQWVEEEEEEAPEQSDGEIISEEVITIEDPNDDPNEDEDTAEEYLVGEEIISSAEMNSIPNSLDQIAAENLIYMAQDGQVTAMSDLIEEQVEQVENADYNEQQYFECQVTEEVITDDWVQPQGEERVEIPVDQLCASGDGQVIEEVDVPLPTDQDEYTALRPYPCDFCSRRFRKKVSLMNHMIAHQNDRPHACNLCGARYIRRSDLLNHLKIHAHVPEQHMEYIDESFITDHIEAKPPRRNDFYTYEEVEKSKDRPKGRNRRMKIKQEVYPEQEELLVERIQEPMVERFPITDPRKPFVCQQCGIGFAREKALSSHSRIHGGDSPYECITCNEMFWDAEMLHEHQRTHHFEASNSEYEPENDEETESENDSKFGEFYCDVCGMSFHRQDLLKRHTKSHIKKELLDGDSHHCCNVCGETFAEALDLLAHAEVHARFQPFKCMLCGETFLEEATIKKHLANVHSQDMTANSCKLCGKQCRDGRALMKHAWDHSREKNHSCSKCGKTFHNKARLKRHLFSHRNKSVTCDVCGEKFPDGRSLMNHRHSHSNVSGRLFPCHECGKTFGSRSSQQIHVRIHTGERPYGCRFCWKAFADGGTLRKHERIHTGEKPYACSVCPRAFNQRVVLREHIRSHHSAPDAKRGTPLEPYFCTVCGELFATSMDLIQHLIQHSDMNTAMQRQPITGPRKYKRRRKLKPHELERLRCEKTTTSDLDYSDLDMVANVDELLGIGKAKRNRMDHPSTSTSHNITISHDIGRIRKYSGGSDKTTASWQQKLMSSTANEDSYNTVFQNIENTLQNIEPLVVNTTSSAMPSSTAPGGGSNSTAMKSKTPTRKRTAKQDTAVEKPSRPKMIHTQKTRVAVEDGKRKTRTMITRTEPAVINDQVYQQFDRTRTSTRRHAARTATDYDLLIPDTMQLESSSPRVIVKSEPSQSDLFDAQLLLEAASMRKELEKYNPDVVNDLEEILRSPIKNKSPPPSNDNIGNSNILANVDECMAVMKGSEEEPRRSTRARRSIKPRKYLEFETSIKTTTRASKIKHDKEEIIEPNKEAIAETSAMPEVSTKIEIESPTKKEEYFQCEMCCAIFADRAQLLVHVPIHI